MKQLSLLIFALLFAGLLGNDVFAMEGQKGKGKGKGELQKLKVELQLTDKQLEQIKAHRKSNKGKGKKFREEIKKLQEDLQAGMKGSKSENELRAIHSQLKSLHDQMADFRFERMMFMRNILTPEQREKFHEMKGKHRGKRGMHKRDGHGPEAGMGPRDERNENDEE